MKEHRFADFVAGILFIVLGVVFFCLADRLQTVRLGIGPAGFPKFVCLFMGLLGIAMTVSTVRQGIQIPKIHVDKRAALRVAAAVAICFAYVELVKTVGFLYLTPVFLFAMMLLFGNRRYLSAAIISVATTVCVWLLFVKVFMIFLPECRLFL